MSIIVIHGLRGPEIHEIIRFVHEIHDRREASSGVKAVVHEVHDRRVPEDQEPGTDVIKIVVVDPQGTMAEAEAALREAGLSVQSRPYGKPH